jgi:aromatic ring-opening dioxygenase catalytic subunit (LigB family)
MGEVLGVGCTHYPGLLRGHEAYTATTRMLLSNPVVSDKMRDMANWPEGARDQWDRQEEESLHHEQRMVAAFRKLRNVIDDFAPDAVIVWGDDQYENFHEDLVPPLAVHCDEEFTDVQPLLNAPKNPWGEPVDTRFTWRGHHEFGKHLATQLMERDFPISYSYGALHAEHGLAHAFANTMLYLDWDRKGWPYPIIPISVNALGRNFEVSQNGFGHLKPELAGTGIDLTASPPGPSPRSLYRLGKLVREIVQERPERVVLMASSSWSHSFLTQKNEWLFPDRDTDRVHFEQLKKGEHHKWADVTNLEAEQAGGHEWKNWICLAGATENRRPTIVDYVESWVFNSNKCFCYFEP